MNKLYLLNYGKYLTYKEPSKFNIKINTVANIPTLKTLKKNLDKNDLDYSKNFWENIKIFNQKTKNK